jgi:hypothetical protein
MITGVVTSLVAPEAFPEGLLEAEAGEESGAPMEAIITATAKHPNNARNKIRFFMILPF